MKTVLFVYIYYKSDKLSYELFLELLFTIIFSV